MTSGPERTPVSASAPDRQEFTVRRAPRLSAVLTLAGLLGFVAALVATPIVRSGPVPPTDPSSGAPISVMSTFGYMLLASLLCALVLGLLVWLLLDRLSRARERTVVLERTDDPAQADVGLDRLEAEQLRARAPHGRTTQQ